MKAKFQILMGILLGCSLEVFAASNDNQTNTDQTQTDASSIDQGDQSDPAKPDDAKQPDLTSQDDPKLVKDVEDALDALKKLSPVVHEDSLRVWKNFKSSSKPVNYTYRFWGRQLIIWLKEEKSMVFHSEVDVGKVFKVLYHKGLISANAVVVLMVDAWGHLVYLEGSPDWEKRKENQLPSGEVAPDGINKNPERPV